MAAGVGLSVGCRQRPVSEETGMRAIGAKLLSFACELLLRETPRRRIRLKSVAQA